MPNSTSKEHIADALIYIFAIIPLAIIFLSELLCAGQGFGVKNCIGGTLITSVTNFFMGYGFLIMFGGFILFLPVMIWAATVSIKSKLRQIKENGAPRKLLWRSPPFIFFI